jgi:hypothetical protein
MRDIVLGYGIYFLNAHVQQHGRGEKGGKVGRQEGRVGEQSVAAEQLEILLILLAIIYISLELLTTLEHTTWFVHLMSK